MSAMLSNLPDLPKLAIVPTAALTAWMASEVSPRRYKNLFTNNILPLSAGLAASVVLQEIAGEKPRFVVATQLAQDVALWTSGFILFEGGLAIRRFLSRPQPIITVRSHSSSDCQAIIAGKKAPGMLSENSLSTHEARSRPNQRLVKAFKIESCFTSSDPDLCIEFRKKAEALLYVEEGKWKDFASVARQIAGEQFTKDSQNLSLFEVIQVVTMKTMLYVLFPDGSSRKDVDRDVAALAAEINHQWVRSKEKLSPGVEPSWSFGNQTALQAVVQAVFPKWKVEDNKDNPFNLILPGYETMWRVVLRCFVEIMARGHTHGTGWKGVLIQFLNEPTKAQLWKAAADEEQGLAAGHISKEALRLYPPTRRIYRAFEDGKREWEAMADIEALHRDPNLWKPDPMIFRPGRWVDREEKREDAAFMAFGWKPFRCPAKRIDGPAPMPFGVSMIALLVGALVEACGESWTVEADLPGDGGPLDTDREAYSEAKLVRLEK